MATGENLVTTLNDIDERRQLLDKVVATARAIENLQDGLNAVLILGDKSAALPDNAYEFFSRINEKTRSQSNDGIQQLHQRLQQLIAQEVAQILEYARMDTAELEEATEKTDALGLLRQFQRMAQTAVALRILIKQRGLPIKGEALTIPADEIKAELKQLKQKEQKQRETIRQQINLMQDELNLLISAPHLDDQMKQPMREALAGLEEDLKKIEAGGKIESLNLSFESVEMEDKLQPPEKQTTTAEEETAEPLPETEAQSPDNPSDLKEKMVKFLSGDWASKWKDIRKRHQDDD